MTTMGLQRPTGNRRVAVLPLANMSSDARDEIFSDGMTEELISALSKIAGLRVIARTSVMRYKNSKKSIGEISKELNVSAILEGSVRRAGNKIRITVQLADPKTEEQLWTEKYDRDLEDIFRCPERNRSEGSRRARDPDQQERETQPRQESNR